MYEQDNWHIEKGSSYYLIRDEGSIISFTVNKTDQITDGLRILGAHTDSPSLKIKPRPDTEAISYLRLGVELYGGPLLHPWFDRELSIAGRVNCRMADKTLRTLLLDFKDPVAVIPSLAIHFNREANKENPINAQKDLPLLFSQSSESNKGNFNTIILNQIKNQYPESEPLEVLGTDLFCYDCNPPSSWGHDNQFISGPRLDNLVSCFVGMTSILQQKTNNNSLLVCTNHEEIGSTTASGASGSFLTSVLERIIPEQTDKYRCLAKSAMISMDNAHALHPNYADRSEENHHVLLNHGPAIKLNANQRYATNSIGCSLFKIIADEAGVPTQDFVMRSDMACGSTIGPLTSAEQGLLTIDVGIPSLAMHSIRETTGSDDPFLLYKSINHFLARESIPTTDTL